MTSMETFRLALARLLFKTKLSTLGGLVLPEGGVIRPSSGSIVARIGDDSIDLVGLVTEEIVALGVILVPEGVTFFRS